MPLLASRSSVYPVGGGKVRRPTLANPESQKQNSHPSQFSPDPLPWAQETHRADPKIWGKEVLRAFRCPEISISSFWGGGSSLQPSPRLLPGPRSQASFPTASMFWMSSPSSFSCKMDWQRLLVAFLFVLWCQECHLVYVLRGATQSGEPGSPCPPAAWLPSPYFPDSRPEPLPCCNKSL